MSEETPKKRIGRPRKSAVEAVKPGNKGKVGRPKGDAAILNEFKARMLASPKSRKVLDKIFDAALDDEHKGQQAAWKLIADRILPISVFEQDIKKSGGKSAISINITGIGGDVSVSGNEEVDTVDAEFVEIKDV